MIFLWPAKAFALIHIGCYLFIYLGLCHAAHNEIYITLTAIVKNVLCFIYQVTIKITSGSSNGCTTQMNKKKWHCYLSNKNQYAEAVSQRLSVSLTASIEIKRLRSRGSVVSALDWASGSVIISITANDLAVVCCGTFRCLFTQSLGGHTQQWSQRSNCCCRLVCEMVTRQF